MTMAPGRHPDGPQPVSARERAIFFGPTMEMEIAAGPHPSQAQQTSGCRASRTEHSALDPRLARARQLGRAAKSP